jgi:hypothetical protein
MFPKQRLLICAGTGTAEYVTIDSVDHANGKFTATFANAHSSTYHIISVAGTFCGPVVIDKAGTTDIITLYDGSPNANSFNSQIGNAFAVITVAAGQPLAFQCACDFGLFYTVGGTPGEYTFQYLDMAQNPA